MDALHCPFADCKMGITGECVVLCGAVSMWCLVSVVVCERVVLCGAVWCCVSVVPCEHVGW